LFFNAGNNTLLAKEPAPIKPILGSDGFAIVFFNSTLAANGLEVSYFKRIPV